MCRESGGKRAGSEGVTKGYHKPNNAFKGPETTQGPFLKTLRTDGSHRKTGVASEDTALPRLAAQCCAPSWYFFFFLNDSPGRSVFHMLLPPGGWSHNFHGNRCALSFSTTSCGMAIPQTIPFVHISDDANVKLLLLSVSCSVLIAFRQHLTWATALADECTNSEDCLID